MSSQAEPSQVGVASVPVTRRRPLSDSPLTISKTDQRSARKSCSQHVEIYPKGREEAHEDFVGVYLYNKGRDKVKAKYKVDIIDCSRKERESFKSTVQEFKTSALGSGWGRHEWLKYDRFNDHPDLLPDGHLTIQCTVSVFGPQKVVSGSDILDSESTDLSNHCQKQLGEHLGKVFSDKHLSNVKIRCEDQTFDCHQVILSARSPVFMAMFQTNMKEKESQTVNIEEFKSKVVGEMLNFIYAGAVSSHESIDGIASELLTAADKYQLDLLKNICEDRLCPTVEVTNCVEYLVLGDMYQTLKLKKKALGVAVENLDSIMDSDVFEDLFKQKPGLALEVMKASHNK